MGTGKTNFLNAVNWCLYQEEPYLSKKSQQLPLLNLNTLDGSNEGDIKDVIIEIWINHEDHLIIFTRTIQFLIASNEEHKGKVSIKKAIQHKIPEFEVKINEGGSFKIYNDEEAQSFVGRIIPSEIRDFFFFDGERLDRYFKEATGQHIRNAIFQISQTSLLEKIENNLRKMISDYEKEAGKDNPNIEFFRTQLEDMNTKKTDISRIMEENRNQIKIARTKIKEYQEQLKGLPKIDELQDERDTLKQKNKELDEFEKEKINDKQDMLFEYCKSIYLYPAIKKVYDLIQQKKANNELPPTGDKELLEKILESKVCSICGRHFNEGSKEEECVKNHLHGISISNDAAIKLTNMENPLSLYLDEFELFKEKMGKISIEIERYEKDKKEYEQRLEEIGNQLRGYNEEKIRNWYRELETFEHLAEVNTQGYGVQQVNFKKVISECEDIQQKLSAALNREKKIGGLKKYIDFSSEAAEILENIRSIVMDQLRDKIANATEKNFFELMWRKETFEKIIISDDYDISVYQFGYPVSPDNLSGGERECLALAFTKALHTISGFDAPILIDRPLAMVSGPPRQYIANILLKLAEEKQLILFLTPDDYKDVASILNSKSCKIHELRISHDEKEVKMEEI